MIKIRITEGYSALIAGNLSFAMNCFIESIKNFPSLARIIEGNILQTQRYFRNQHREVRKLINFIILDQDNEQKLDELDLNYKIKIKGRIFLKNNSLIFNEDCLLLQDEKIGSQLVNFVVSNPSTHIYDNVASAESLLLNLLYKLIWNTEVRIVINKNSYVPLDRYLNKFIHISVIAQMSSNLHQNDVDLISLLCHKEQRSNVDNSQLLNQCIRVVETYSELFAGDDSQFLNAVFEISLDRKIYSHEQKYYSELLSTKRNNRKEIISLIFSGEEYKRHIADSFSNKIKTGEIFSHPQLNEIIPSDINLPFCNAPKVSVLIPVYGKVEYTLACLKSIADHPAKVGFEVIVMDDRSPDNSVKMLQEVINLNVICNPYNMGFLRSCNNGTKFAKGEFLYFLNNDTQVRDGWLDELIETFNNFPNCGLVGSKLIYPDGLLQEAGGIVWQDGSAWNYGSRQDPNLPEFNYARDVDYISGASIMVPANLFSELGGFDEIYAPAYYEDTDLAFRIKTIGKRVIYQPLSQIVHFEGISSGTDVGSGIKAYQVVNQQKFKTRWQQTLQTHRSNGDAPQLERDRGVKGRVLFIDACTPTPDQDSGSIDIFNLMKVFVDMNWAVSFIPEDNYAYMEKYTPALQKLGIQVLYHPFVKSVEDHLTDYGKNYALVMSFRPLVTQKHIQNIRLKCENAKVVFNTVDLHFLRLDREAKLKNDISIAKEAQKYKEIEFGLMNEVDLTTVVSSAELDLLRKAKVERVVHLPFSREIHPSSVSFESRSGLIFVGGFQHNPNVDAIKYFVFEMMPFVRRLIPGVVLNIVGSNMPNDIKNLACHDIIAHGFIENLEDLMSTVRVNVAPLRYGAGTKGKVVHALANGLPTVATAVAIEGMGLSNEKNIAVADNPTDFAKNIATLYKQKNYWNSIANNGINYVENNYGISALKKNLNEILISLGI